MSKYADIRRARKFRRDANLPEQKAWRALRGLRAHGYAVRRQQPIDRYTVDFAIRSQRLIIEIDGSIHDRDDVKARDALRDARLAELGWRVIRIPAAIAMNADLLLTRMQAELGI